MSIEQIIESSVAKVLGEAIANGDLIGRSDLEKLTQGGRWMDIKGISGHIMFGPGFVNKYLYEIAHRPTGTDPRWFTTEVDNWMRTNGLLVAKEREKKEVRVERQKRGRKPEQR